MFGRETKLLLVVIAAMSLVLALTLVVFSSGGAIQSFLTWRIGDWQYVPFTVLGWVLLCVTGISLRVAENRNW